MPARRYTVVIADRLTGIVRDVTVSLPRVVLVCAAVFSLPVLIGLGARWSARLEIEQLRATNAALEVENGNYRAATGALTSQIQALGTVVEDLGARSALDPELARAMDRLPSVVKARAAGGTTHPAGATVSSVLSTAFTSPEDTFGVLRSLLAGLESRLRTVRGDVERREALAAATPSIWPAHGWLTGSFGRRSDPLSGEEGFHQGIDISAAKGQPVYATADGVVESASYAGEYGNLLVLAHDFGLSTRYAHLSKFNVQVGARVKRGDVVGFIGSTGRSTGWHLHYEILANGKLINPLQLLTQPSRRREHLAQ
jgi:murein DD-endopeptidase MepM/ murein hydrolase activator NlpD